MSTRRAITVLTTLVLVGCGQSGPSPSVAPSTALVPSQQAIESAMAPSGSPSTSPASAQPSSPSPAASGQIDPSQFSATVDNPWFPLKPGTVTTYVGTKDGKRAVDVVTVTHDVVLVDGVPCVAIADRLTLDGVLEERTTDYYTQDKSGNVWYFGELTSQLDTKGNVVSREGSWQAGLDGAQPGIYMDAAPKPGDTFIQEFYKGHAEDHFRVKVLAASVTVPYGAFTNAVMTEEWTPLEPDVLDHKYYVRNLGQVKEVSVKGPLERLELSKLTRP